MAHAQKVDRGVEEAFSVRREEGDDGGNEGREGGKRDKETKEKTKEKSESEPDPTVRWFICTSFTLTVRPRPV